jgi:tetratricopeptide (TPR) repeat protein
MRSAVRHADGAGADELLAMCLGELLHCEMVLGLPFDAATATRALELEARLELPAASYFRPSISLAIVYTATDRLDDARQLLERELARIESTGDEAIRWGVLTRISDVELRAGNLGAAVSRAREGLEAARLLDHWGVERFALVPYAAALSRTGRVAEARDLATEALAQSSRIGSRLTALRALGTLGFCALSEDDAEDAWKTLEPAVAELQELGVGELSIFGVAPDAIEALVALRRPDEATKLVEWVEAAGARAGRAAAAGGRDAGVGRAVARSGVRDSLERRRGFARRVPARRALGVAQGGHGRGAALGDAMPALACCALMPMLAPPTSRPRLRPAGA